MTVAADNILINLFGVAMRKDCVLVIAEHVRAGAVLSAPGKGMGVMLLRLSSF